MRETSHDGFIGGDILTKTGAICRQPPRTGERSRTSAGTQGIEGLLAVGGEKSDRKCAGRFFNAQTYYSFHATGIPRRYMALEAILFKCSGTIGGDAPVSGTTRPEHYWLENSVLGC